MLVSLPLALALMSCGSDDSSQGTIEPSPLPDALSLTLEEVARNENWNLVGPCELHGPDDPDFEPGAMCYLEADTDANETSVWVGPVGSQASHRVILTSGSSGEYAIAGVTPVLTPATGK